jgi:hypothetical protein
MPFPPILFEAIQFEKTIPDLAPKDKRPHSRTRVGAFHFFAQGRKMVEYMKSLFATTKLSISRPFSVSVDFLLLLHMAMLAQQSRLRLAQTLTQTFSQHGEMFGPTGYVVARNDMDLHLIRLSFSFNQSTPFLSAMRLFFSPKERDPARIRVRHVTRKHPVIYICPPLSQDFTSWDKRIRLRRCSVRFASLKPTLTLYGSPHMFELIQAPIMEG